MTQIIGYMLKLRSWTTVGGISEVVEDDYNGILFDVNNQRDIIHKVNLLIENVTIMTDFGKRIQDKVVKRFSLESMVEGTEDVY
jgi:glycosyltransferase involved in cell wall biosynthesis